MTTRPADPPAGRGPGPARPPRWWQRLPLRTQLTALCALLLVIGLTVTGLTALTLLRQSLVAQLDVELSSATPRLLSQATGGLPGGHRVQDGLPSDYYVVFAGPTGEVASRWSTSEERSATPDLPSLTADDVGARAGEAFTVASASAGVGGQDQDAGRTRWRVLARPLVSRGEVIGSMAVALPMTGVDRTLTQMRSVLLATGAVVIGGGALAGRWGVRRALRSLREIEATAAAIATGDLARRVPDAPASTEVGRLAGALNGMLGQVERAFAARTASEHRMRQFVADASHELRTPLATIRGYGELYRMGALTTKEEVDRTMQRMEDSATRMGALVEDLLHLARLDEGRPLRREPVDLLVLVADAAADLRALDPTRPVRLQPLTSDAAMGAASVTGDEDRLRQVLANLIGNVATHTPRGTPVELAVGRVPPADRQVVVEVRDHGPGIAPEHVGRVFERFYRADAARGRERGGAGLGMAIVDAIVTAHGGSVELVGTPGGGATVRVVLPAA